MEQPRFDPMTGKPLHTEPQGTQEPPKTPPQPVYRPAPELPGKSEAITSLVLGIVALCFCTTSGLIGLALGITGLIFASQAKRRGYRDGMRTGGFVTSLLAVIFGSVSVLIGSILRSVFVAFSTGILEEILEDTFLI